MWQIGLADSFTGVSIQNVNAHGHAQIFGWVGLFIMGFAYQALPRFWNTTLADPYLAAAVFITMIFVLALPMAGMMMHSQPRALGAAMTGGAIELLAITTFVSQLATTFRKSNDPVEPSNNPHASRSPLYSKHRRLQPS
ncbi:MAG: hypothetical protein IT445_11185 [Phycisphaeraceae bacterium]|nr:hypothetical protein [Phycisphaeraceae bacterium]